MKKVAVINYEMGNLHSVSKALENAAPRDVKVFVTNSKPLIESADAIVLPGVGAFGRGIENLARMDLIDILKKKIKNNCPFLGICLGLQLLFSKSEEHGSFNGLDVIKGKVIRFNLEHKIPHMGWNQIKRVTSYKLQITSKNLKSKAEHLQLFNNIPDESYFYFVHSYYVMPQDKDCVIATTDYGVEFASAIKKDNIYGVQFHPEKSSSLGLQVFSNFLKIASEV